MKQILKSFKRFLNFGEDELPEQDVVSGISADIDFHGAKLWLLVIAVFVASLGLNTNNTAVIIGAMLISPLMGPIIGMGLGVGIYDFSLFKKSFHNYLIATLFSIATATLYFLVTPINQVQSELLARTSPTTYDVCIALFGGLAGIIAVCSRSQRNGNVIPGVAIATALMPPLCTVGYGLAMSNWSFAVGAIYLYLINTVFIAFSTSVCVAFILKFKKKKFVNKEQDKRIRRIIIAIVIATMIPSVFLTYRIVCSTVNEKQTERSIEQDDMNSIISEMKILYPSIEDIVVSRGKSIKTDSISVGNRATVVVIAVKEKLSDNDANRIRLWLNQRTGLNNLIVTYILEKDFCLTDTIKTNDKGIQ